MRWAFKIPSFMTAYQPFVWRSSCDRASRRDRVRRVQMLIDQNAAAGALIERTRVQGVVIGLGDALRMDYVPGTADVQKDDVVVTSGIDAIYPKGFVIGTVESVERGPGTYHQIRVRPAVDFSRLEAVLVVTTPTPAKADEDAEKGVND